MPSKLTGLVGFFYLISAARAGSTTGVAVNLSTTAAATTPPVTTASTTTIPTSLPTSSATTGRPCTGNATVFESCLKNGLGVNTSLVEPTFNYSCLVGGSQCDTTTPLSTCSSPNITTNDFYGLLCTTSGLNLYPLSANSCAEIYSTTAFMCGDVLRLKNITCTGSYNGHVALTSTEASSVLAVLVSSCPKPKTTPLPLLPNPVGPEAITAIVVLVCLTITAILAGFFFWPKCHIANPAAEAIKQATKPSSAKTATAAASSGAVSKTSTTAASGGAAGTSGGNSADSYNVNYVDGNRNAASIKMASLPGPSAA